MSLNLRKTSRRNAFMEVTGVWSFLKIETVLCNLHTVEKEKLHITENPHKTSKEYRVHTLFLLLLRLSVDVSNILCLRSESRTNGAFSHAEDIARSYTVRNQVKHFVFFWRRHACFILELSSVTI